MSDIFMTDAVCKALLNLAKDHTGAAGPLDGAKCGLFISGLEPNGKMALGDIDEPAAAGYARSAALVFGATFNGPAGVFGFAAPSVTFRRSNSTDPGETIHGWFIVNGAGDTLLVAKRFDEDASWTNTDDVVIAVPRFGLAVEVADPLPTIE